MSIAVDNLEDAIKLTQETLKPIFSKPKCSSKLLGKPPFRFVHDIIIATKKSTGFPNRYFSKEELDSTNLKNKDVKVAFLKKFVYLVSVCHGSPINVRPVKIVAGLEPLNTNVLLTLFGKVAVDTEFDHDAAIAHCMTGGEIGMLPSTNIDLDNDQDEKNESKEPEIKSSQIEKDFKGRTASMGNLESDTAESKTKIESLTKKSDNSGVSGQMTELELQASIKGCNSNIALTQVAINSIISKPRCSEKLLSKPPFRFIHDVLMAVNEATDMDLGQVYSPEEMDSSKVKDKASKVSFLSKIVHHLERDLGVTIDMNPTKVIAGLEADKTRHFLQLFVIAATDHKLLRSREKIELQESENENISLNRPDDTNRYVREADVPETKESMKPPNLHDLHELDLKAEPRFEIKQGLDPDSKEGDAESVSTRDDGPQNTAPSKQQYEENVSRSDYKSLKSPERAPITEGTFPSKDDNLALNMNPSIEHTKEKNKSVEIHEPKYELPSTSSGKRMEESISKAFFGIEGNRTDGRDEDIATVTTRPKTARRRPPKIQDQQADSNRSHTLQRTLRKPPVFRDYDKPDVKSIPNENSTTSPFKTFATDIESPHDLSSKIAISKQNEKYNSLHRRGMRGSNPTPATAFKSTPYNLHAIAGSIQNLARSTAPIGKVLDYLSKEMEKMKLERAHWSQEYYKFDNELIATREKSNDDLKPLKRDMKSVEEEIQRIHRLTHVVHMKIRKNEERIRYRLQHFIEHEV